MTEIQGKSILVRVSEGSSYRESTVLITFFLYKNMCDKNMCASFNPSKLKELKILKKMTSKPADAYGHIKT